MPAYKLTLDAEQDLLDIAIYTVKTWVLAQADSYEIALEHHLDGLGRGEVRTSTPIPHRPELRASRCMHHHVFSLHEEDASPLIIAVLHEKMDLMTRLGERLGPEQ
jgi:toxin ParE1/3/4